MRVLLLVRPRAATLKPVGLPGCLGLRTAASGSLVADAVRAPYVDQGQPWSTHVYSMLPAGSTLAGRGGLVMMAGSVAWDQASHYTAWQQMWPLGCSLRLAAAALADPCGCVSRDAPRHAQQSQPEPGFTADATAMLRRQHCVRLACGAEARLGTLGFCTASAALSLFFT